MRLEYPLKVSNVVVVDRYGLVGWATCERDTEISTQIHGAYGDLCATTNVLVENTTR